jgi:hypothetical protein
MKSKKPDQCIDGAVTKSLQNVSDEPGYNETLLPFPSSASARARKKISTEGKVLHDALVRTGVRFRDEDINRSYDITQKEEAFGMLVNDRQFGVYQTAPQCIATALIVSEIARQAILSRKALKYSLDKPDSFEMVLDAMDKIANMIGPLANYRTFQMDVGMAAAVIFQNTERFDELFDAMGNCDKDHLVSQAARFSMVRAEGLIQSIEIIKDAKPALIARAVKNSGSFDFSVGKAPIHDRRFVDSLVKHLEQQRQNAMKLH